MENFLDRLNQIALQLKEWIWGIPLIVLLLAVGILLSVRMHFLQLRQLPRALKFMVRNEEGGSGEVSSFGALCTALSATIGTGNIVGVATAISLGGPGALFWMWVAAFFGMATKYAEGLLAVKYRTVDADGHVLGGAFYYIERGIAERFPKWKGFARVLAILFAVFGAGAGLLGIGTITQVNGIASAIQNLTDPEKAGLVVLFGHQFGFTWTTLIVAVVTALLVGLVIIGGIRRISGVSQVVVPVMACLYVVICIAVLIVNARAIPDVFVRIFQGAFGLRAAAGGAAGAMFLAMQQGIARGMFSNESGLGSASIAAAAAKTDHAARQGLVTMTGTFIDTLVICTMTGLAILSTSSHQAGLEGAAITANAFATVFPFLPVLGKALLAACLVFFAFTTILGWDYYGERCVEYLSKGRSLPIKIYRWVYIFAVLAGPFLTVAFVWNFSDALNGLMSFPNLIALFVLSGVCAKETAAYLSMLREQKHSEKRKHRQKQ
ncbi:MAG: sodium:alanine symporter family protein [Firmicutes bacterium]|nr:sodium:alanine symporter family protein [Bacillota bacterium]